MFNLIYWVFLIHQTVSVLSLDCYLCAENNLDEFGECKQQFRLDCSSYASKFGPNERIFCRTTRQKAVQNNTYTIMKECISEKAHYQTFPKKNYELDEECDLIEVQNYEIAYCLCKTSLCNEPPIVDQFTNFEKKYPELFGKMPEDGPPGQEPTQESVEEPFMPPPVRFRLKTDIVFFQNINGDLRRQPTSRPLNENNNAKSIDLKEISVNAPGIFIGHVANKHLVDGNHAPISNTNVRDLICSQCGQNNLTDELSDCNKQINVNCAQQTAGNEKSYCFTRQIIIGSGQNAIEKMCVSEQNIIHEFGVEKVIEGCESMGNGRIRYCICSTENCNSLSILEQFAMANHLSGDHTGQSLAEMPSRAISDEFDERKLNPAKNLQITSLTPKIEAPAIAPSDNENNLTPLHCQVCAEDNVKDETSDCMRITVIDCAQQSNSPKTACLTRQTFLSTGNYAVEKRCINEHEAEHFVKNSHSFDHKSLKISPIGTVCGVTEDEGTKFCLCDSDMCNRFGLKEQVQQYEYYFPSQVQTSSMAHTAMAPTSSTKRTSTMPQTTTTETEMDYRERQIDHPHGNSYMAVTSPSKIDREENSDNDFEENMRNSIKERQERWKDSTQNNSCSSIFINSFILVLITMLTMSFLT